ncbi:hypothetical protein CBF23_003755 [Marinomonas agarivorans]|nr:hypothetical protein CBF23_003755 [Marinomonas agarivorans]
MPLSSGNFFAIPVNQEDPTFETVIEAKEGLRVVSASRALPATAQTETSDDFSALKDQLQSGIDELKQGGWQGIKTLLQKLATQLIGELTGEKKKQAAPVKEAVDPLDPKTAFALVLPDNQVKYELVRNLADKDKDLDYYEFRSSNSYGLLFQVADNVFKEIIFTYPNANYAEHYFPEQSTGLPDWRREDYNLHKMRVYFLSKDKSLAEKYAKEADFEQEKQTLFAVDKTSTRAGQKSRFSMPELEIDARTSEVSMNFLYAWYLPTQTKAGRQIQYNWDALRVVIRQGDKIIKRRVCWSTSRKRAYIESTKTAFELMDSGYMGELAPGSYTLDVYIYDEHYFSYPFDVLKIDSEDLVSEPASYYAIKALGDDYAQLSFDSETHSLSCYYPLKKLLGSHASAKKFDIALRTTKEGKAWPEWGAYEGYGESDDREIRNNPSWSERPIRLNLPFGNQESHEGRLPAPDGNYVIHIDVDGKEFDQIHFAFKDGEFVADKTLPDIGIANVDLPNEHLGFLFPLQGR